MSDAPVSPSSPQPASTRLDGWKAISSYFGKGVRTVQRWEAELGMPVHRIGLLRGETVYALADELEAWQRAMESRGSGGAEVAAPEAPSAPHLPRSSSDGRARRPGPERGRRARWAMLGTVAMVLIAVGGWAVRSAFSTHPGSGSGGALSQPARADIEGNALVVYDSAGHPLWRHRFDFRLTAASYREERRVGRDPVLIDDLDGDGSQEVLFVAEPDQIGPNGALYCFDRSGALRFVYRAQYRVTYGPLKCVPPWRPSFAKAFGKPGRPHRIWFVSFHLKEFPTVVDELDPMGNVLGHYWSDGQVMTLSEATIGGRPVVLAGGVNNETHGASLAVLDARRPTGTAPAESGHYKCPDCPAGSPLAFLVFPALDATLAIGSYATVETAAADADGQITVVLVHDTGGVIPAAETSAESESLYVLDSRFRVVKAELGQGYRAVHRVFEKKGYVDHPFGAAEDARLLWPVRRWNAAAGRFDLVAGVESGR